MAGSLITPEKSQSTETHSNPIPDSQTNTQENTFEAVERKRFMSDFLFYLKESHFEDCFKNQADDYLEKTLESNLYDPCVSDWIEALYLENEDDLFIIERILSVLAYFEIEEVSPIGPILAEKALSHTDFAIQDMGIRAFESWKDKRYVPILESTVCHDNYLNDYLKKVIQYLKGF